MSEIELKFIVDRAASRTVWQRARALGYCDATPRARTLRSIYFDTPGNVLRHAGISLRLRHTGGRWVQSVKKRRGLNGGLSQSHEVEAPVAAGTPSLDLIPDEALRKEIVSRLGDASLDPVWETQMRRSSGEVRLASGTRAEMAVDTGEIVAGERSADLHEVEIELIEGNAEDLFELAKMLFPSGGLRFSRYSKGARGFMLASSGYVEPPLAPRPAEDVPLRRSQTVERAARDVLRECRQQIATNIRAILEMDDPEGPHQLRVGLRRLRSALSVFDPILAVAEGKRLRAEAQWLGVQVGRLRDVEAVLADVVLPEAENLSDEAVVQGLVSSLQGEASARREALRRLLTEERAQAFTLDLVRFIETRGWLVALDIEQSGRLAMPVSKFARAALAKRWKRTRKHARNFDALTVEQRHELRKELKKLRYLTEFFAPLFAKKRVRLFLKRLRRLQTVFGRLNDAQVAQHLLSELAPPEGADMAAVNRACGFVIGSSHTRAETGWGEAKALWRDLEGIRPFWR